MPKEKKHARTQAHICTSARTHTNTHTHTHTHRDSHTHTHTHTTHTHTVTLLDSGYPQLSLLMMTPVVAVISDVCLTL